MTILQIHFPIPEILQHEVLHVLFDVHPKGHSNDK